MANSLRRLVGGANQMLWACTTTRRYSAFKSMGPRAAPSGDEPHYLDTHKGMCINES